jgi:hypothetical protein
LANGKFASGRHVTPRAISRLSTMIVFALTARGRVDERGEARDDTALAQAVDAPLDRRRGQVHPLAELGQAAPAVLEQLGDDAPVDLVEVGYAASRGLGSCT